jgi:molybdopterin synthase catalytic subunit
MNRDEPADLFLVTDAPLDPAAYLDRCTVPRCGALAAFVGTVRSPNRGHEIEHLVYEAYRPMVTSQMAGLAHQARERWELGPVAIVHRVGRLLPGEASIAIVVAAPHRAAALAACAFLIDTAKVVLPVWKKEVTTTGEHWVEGVATAGPTL